LRNLRGHVYNMRIPMWSLVSGVSFHFVFLFRVSSLFCVLCLLMLDGIFSFPLLETEKPMDSRNVGSSTLYIAIACSFLLPSTRLELFIRLVLLFLWGISATFLFSRVSFSLTVPSFLIIPLGKQILHSPL